MGGGDVKLSALMGAALGFGGWLQAILIGSFGGVIAGGLLALAGRANLQTPIPYGTFLSVGAILLLLIPGFLL
jgi:prepilin signal peptidase PulO-like enzyme (type II secretory pathway)